MPDPDGRYRIKEFFCYNDTWQMTMERLAAASDAVLMDLRSFSRVNQGCIFELGRLLDGVWYFWWMTPRTWAFSKPCCSGCGRT